MFFHINVDFVCWIGPSFCWFIMQKKEFMWWTMLVVMCKLLGRCATKLIVQSELSSKWNLGLYWFCRLNSTARLSENCFGGWKTFTLGTWWGKDIKQCTGNDILLVDPGTAWEAYCTFLISTRAAWPGSFLCIRNMMVVSFIVLFLQHEKGRKVPFGARFIDWIWFQSEIGKTTSYSDFLVGSWPT